jgi:hypothetical protein
VALHRGALPRGAHVRAVAAAALLYGPVSGILAAAVIYLPAVTRWEDPYCMLVLMAETAWIGYLYPRRKGWLIEPDLAFWVLVGAPVTYVLCRYVGHLPLLDAMVVVLKQVFDSMLTTAAA